MTMDVLVFLFFSAFLAGLVDAVAGGGGLIALPALLFAGIPPQLALGTNKLQGSFGTLTASFNYIRKGQASLKEAWVGIVFTLVGAAAGAGLVQQLDPDFLVPVIPVLLFLVFIYTLFSRDLGVTTGVPRLHHGIVFVFLGVILGFYDGFFGPGTGSFWTMGFMVLLGMNMTRASGFTKIMNFTSNIVALVSFVIGGNVLYSVGLVMACGQILGAVIGSSLAIQKGARFIRPVFLTVIFLTILRLGYQNYAAWFSS
ncbi:TSUP family transporter [Desulfocicer niacini]